MVSLGIFSVVPPTEPCALRSTQPLKVSTRNLSWGKGGRCVWLTTYHPCSAETSRKSGALSTLNPLDHLDLSRDTFTFTFTNGLGQNSSVGIATRYGLDRPAIESRWARDFSRSSRASLGPTQPPAVDIGSSFRG